VSAGVREYVIRRLLLMVPTAFLATLIIFLLMKLVPGDVAMAIVYGSAETGAADQTREATERRVGEVRKRYGLDKPLPVQYWDWLKTVGTGEFGRSIWEFRPVREIILERLPRTIELAVIILVLTVLYGIPLGVLAALWQNTAKDHAIRLFTILGLSVPTIWIGTLFLFYFSRYVGWLPPLDWKGPLEAPLHNLAMVAAPALIVTYNVGSSVMRLTRSQMLEVIREDYIRTAWAKGLEPRRVLMRHALRNALLPVLTQFGGLFSVTLLGLIITETIFHIPGMGRSLVDAIVNRDYPVIQGFILVNVAMVMVINLIVDLLYSVIDPRIRYS
jgi:peptide/nickel transport system permease protein